MTLRLDIATHVSMDTTRTNGKSRYVEHTKRISIVLMEKGKQTMTEYIVNPEEEQHLFYGRKYEELIRCMDCKYWDGKYHDCSFHDDGRDWDSDDYCSRAERETE